MSGIAGFALREGAAGRVISSFMPQIISSKNLAKRIPPTIRRRLSIVDFFN